MSSANKLRESTYPREHIEVNGAPYIHWTTFGDPKEPWEGHEPQFSRFSNREALYPLLAEKGIGMIPVQPPVDIYGQELPGSDFYVRTEIGLAAFVGLMDYLSEAHPYTFDFMGSETSRVIYMPPSDMARVVDEAMEVTGLAARVAELEN